MTGHANSDELYTHKRCWKDPKIDPETDRSVYWQGMRIGRVTYNASLPGGPVWCWSCHFNAIISDQLGYSATREESLEQVRVRHEREGCPGPIKGTGPHLSGPF